MSIRRVLLLPGALFIAVQLLGLQSETPREHAITGQLRLGGDPSPAGVVVTLQIVPGAYATPSTEAEVAQAKTDSTGRFIFDHLETVGKKGGREFFAVSAQSPGYAWAYRVIDLTLAARAETTLDLSKPPKDSLLPGGASSPHDPANPAAKQSMDRAQELLFRKNDPKAAIEELRQVVKADPWYGPGYLLLGLAYMQTASWSDAEWAFTEAGKVEPGNAQAFLGAGSALNEQHDYVGARKALEQSLELNPESAEAHYELARSLGALDKWEAAAPHALRAIEINPDYAGPHALMGNVYLEQRRWQAALTEFRDYLLLDPAGSLAPSVKQIIADIEKQTGHRSR